MNVDGRLPSLLRQSGEGDEVAFAAVYDTTATRAYGLGLRLLRDGVQAAEVVQEAYLHLWEHSARFQSTQGSAISWILMTVHRCAVSRLLSMVRRVPSDDPSGEAFTGPASSALSKLPSTQRQSVELSYFGGYTHTEVEQMMGLPAGTAQTEIRDGLRALHERGARSVGPG